MTIITSTTIVHIAIDGEPQRSASLADCFPDDNIALADALDDLARTGAHRGGGGAAPLYVLTLQPEE